MVTIISNFRRDNWIVLKHVNSGKYCAKTTASDRAIVQLRGSTNTVIRRAG